MNNTKKYIGSNFDHYLEEENLLAETEALALKKVLVWELYQAMEEKKLTKTAVAKLMHTSRAAFNRLLNPDNTSLNLMSMEKAAIALGKKIHIELKDL